MVTKKFDYFGQLQQKGFVSKGGQLKRKVLFEKLYEPLLQVLPEASPLLPRSDKDYKYWSAVARDESSQPPFKHLMLEFMLKKLPPLASPVSVSKSCVSDKVLITKCIKLLEQGESYAAVGRLTGKSSCFIRLLAEKKGIRNNKPTLITNKIKKEIIKLAWKGFHRSAIARMFNISNGSVEHIISTTEGMVSRRKRCKYESKRRRHKVTLIRYIRAHLKANRQQIKQACNAAFFWFYLNEKEFLESVLPTAQRTQRRERVDWKARDQKLVTQVRAILQQSNSPITKAELDRLLGNHGWIRSKLHKLPLTQEAIKRSTRLLNQYITVN